MTLTNEPIDSIKPAPYNPKQISAKMRKALMRSIEQYGFIMPVIVSKASRRLVDGHSRLMIARELGIKDVPVIWADDLPHKDEASRLIAVSQIHGQFDMPKLKDLLVEIDTGEHDNLEHVGFNADDLAGLFDYEPPAYNNDIACPKCGHEFKGV